MKEAITAKSYARSFIALGDEKGVDVVKDFTSLTEAINASGEFETVLFMDVFSVDEKKLVLNDVLALLKTNALTSVLISFLIQEKRFQLFPLIFKEMVVLDDYRKGFLRGVIEGADAVLDEQVRKQIVSYVEKKLGVKVDLSYAASDKISAGFKVNVQDLQLDMTLDGNLKTLL